ncbi:PPOX class F420-dependent oxidoreductase [Kineococcus sp. LSe6-4]|uniref:PPOX class F420-dependent oxidoreductase n=1 Tax=Kineococcus halophytocola TaxID=3234027 RepID=A0ABV4H469_9ACTN
MTDRADRTDRVTELLAGTSYVLLTTFCRDGRLVPTPVWAAPLGDGRLVLVTQDGTGKVKRIRRDPHVLLAPCSRRGTPLGRPVDGTAQVLPDDRLPEVERALAGKYGLEFSLFQAVEGLVRRRGRTTGRRVAVALTVEP